MLEVLGLSAEADAVYRLMLAHRDWGVSRIAAHLTVSPGAVREALDELAERRLLRTSTVEGEWRPVRPAVGLAALFAEAEAELTDRFRRLSAARSALAALAAEHDDGYQRDAITRLEGAEAVRDRLAELATGATRECLSLNPNTAQTPAAKSASRGLNAGLLSRGVAIRCVYQESFRNDPALLEYGHWLTAAGGQARTAPSVPLMMVVFDRRTALFPLDPADSGRGAVDVSHPGVVAAACALFDQVWAVATPFGAPAATAADGLGASQRELLGLLADGHTDESAARKLGVSLTTVRRMMAALMERLESRSRFQAGVRAAERGWLR